MLHPPVCLWHLSFSLQVYSHGLSEIMLGKAIKDLQLPREELVILTKVHVLHGAEIVCKPHSCYVDMRASCAQS